MRKILCILAVLALALSLTACATSSGESLPHMDDVKAAVENSTYSLPLPDGFTLETGEDGSAALTQDGQVVGGVLFCPSSNVDKITSGKFDMDTEDILDALKAVGAPGSDTEVYDYMLETGLYGDWHLWSGNPEQEYQHDLYILDNGILSLWFDLNQIEKQAADEVGALFSVSR